MQIKPSSFNVQRSFLDGDAVRKYPYRPSGQPSFDSNDEERHTFSSLRKHTVSFPQPIGTYLQIASSRSSNTLLQRQSRNSFSSLSCMRTTESLGVRENNHTPSRRIQQKHHKNPRMHSNVMKPGLQVSLSEEWRKDTQQTKGERRTSLGWLH
ncbi:hypothetical protein BDV98DRAFT_311896 [Pterulicium gracile]|uniref:Uncharacterized protein n=1 Tax=Pterulicium gracile TaxID=1884261 RepID=A0A5C3Q2L8_9AGAR|nr:hypothetical protein BDV98DRAFT_311896 [Pterula gracilis]